MWLFYCFSYERDSNALKSKSPFFFFLKKNLNKNETELKIENPAHVSRGKNILSFS